MGEQTWPSAAIQDAAHAVMEFDTARQRLAEPPAGPVPPVAAEAWVFDPELKLVLLVHHRWRGWVPPGGKVEAAETPRAAAARELWEETGLHADLMPRPAAVSYRSYHPCWTATLGLSYAAIEDPTTALRAEPGQPAAWMPLARDWQSCFAEDPQRIRTFASMLPGELYK